MLIATLAHGTLELASVMAGGGDDGGVKIPNPAPADPTAGSNGIALLLSYIKWGALIACACAAVASGGLMAVGSLSNRPDHVDKGKRAFLWAMGGVIASAIAIPMVNTVFNATT